MSTNRMFGDALMSWPSPIHNGTSEDDAQPRTGNRGRRRHRPIRANHLQIARQLQPGRNMKIVKQLELVLGAKATTDRQQIEVVLQHGAQIRVRERDSELVSPTPAE